MFRLKKVDQIIAGKIIYQLAEDNCYLFDEFCAEIEKESNLTAFLIGAFKILGDLANENRLPTYLVKPLKGKLKNEWEIRKGSIRIYFIKDSRGHIIISGGKKNSQPSDIKTFQNIHKRFLQPDSTVIIEK